MFRQSTVIKNDDEENIDKGVFEESKRDLEGMQPTFKHVPPKVLYFSTSAVFIPN